MSLVIPMYNEAETLQTCLDRVVPILHAVTPDYEIVCVNDGSADQTCELLRVAHAQNPRIKIISLTRNFGKEAALTARWFYRVLGRLSEVPIPANAGDFRLMDRRVVAVLKRLPERTRFMKGLFAWLGFKQGTISYVRPPRVAGASKWKVWTLWNLALEGLFSFTTLPLRIWTYIGLTIAVAALGYMGVIIGRTLLFGVDVPGYASIVSMLLFFNGIQIIGFGVLGEYLGRVFLEVKQRPLYLVRDAIGFDTSPTIAPQSPQAQREPSKHDEQAERFRP